MLELFLIGVYNVLLSHLKTRRVPRQRAIICTMLYKLYNKDFDAKQTASALQTEVVKGMHRVLESTLHTGLHFQKAYTHSVTSCPQCYTKSSDAYIHFAKSFLFVVCPCIYASLLQLDLNAYTRYTHLVSNCNSQAKCIYA